MGDDNMSLPEKQLNSKPPAAEDPTFDGLPPAKEVSAWLLPESSRNKDG